LIPDLFAAVNAAKNAGKTADLQNIPGGKAADCVKCGKCEENCPQFLPIRDLLRKLAKEEA
jgi:predicted aldo/keto reductase-like oxidoreductase